MAIWRNVADEKLATAKSCKHLKANFQVDVIRGRVSGRMKKLITKDQHTYFLRQRQG